MRRHPRHALALLAALVLALAVGACGSSGGGTGSSGGGSTNASSGSGVEHPKVGVVLHFTAIDYFKRFIVGAQDGAKAVGGSVVVTGTPTPDPPAEVRMFRDIATKLRDGIGVVPSTPTFWVRPLQDVADQGVPLLATVEPPAAASASTVKTFVGDNGFQSGATLATEIAKLVRDPNRAGTIVIGTGDPSIDTFINRIAGMKSVIEQKLPNAQVVVQTVGLEPVKNLSTWQALFHKYSGSAIAFLADGEHSGPNLAKVAAQQPGDYRVGLVDDDIPTVQGIEAGKIDVSIGGVPYLRGYLTGRILAQAAKEGKPMPTGFVNVCCEVITKDNAAASLKRLSSIDAMRAYYAPIFSTQFANLAAIPTAPLGDSRSELAPATAPNPWLTPPGS
jgi:ribose transport system substrate-binding protein